MTTPMETSSSHQLKRKTLEMFQILTLLFHLHPFTLPKLERKHYNHTAERNSKTYNLEYRCAPLNIIGVILHFILHQFVQPTSYRILINGVA